METATGAEMSGDDAGIQIRIATADDVQPIAAVLRSAFLEYERCYTSEGFAATTPSEEQIYQRLSEGPVWVALQGERIVGTVSAIARGQACYVRSMAIFPTARGQRIGARLLEKVEQF